MLFNGKYSVLQTYPSSILAILRLQCEGDQCVQFFVIFFTQMLTFSFITNTRKILAEMLSK